jgi:hypothetical protein
MRTMPLVFLIPMMLVACKDGAAGQPQAANGTGSGTEPADTSAGSVDRPTTDDTNPGTGTGSATGNGTTSGDPTGNPTGDPTGDPPTDHRRPRATSTGVRHRHGLCGRPTCSRRTSSRSSKRAAAPATTPVTRGSPTVRRRRRDCRGWLASRTHRSAPNYYSGPMEGNRPAARHGSVHRLINLDAWQCEQFEPRVRYVVAVQAGGELRRPQDRRRSVLLLTANDMPSQPMPLGKVLDPKSVKTIKAWIAAGAPRIGDPCPCATAATILTPVLKTPVAQINHPGDGEVRKVNVDIPFVGLANDPQDGKVPADKLIWTSDLEGQIGVGDNFNAPLTMVGKHTITLTATDIDGNEGTASLVLNME